MELASEQQADSALSFLQEQAPVVLDASILISAMSVDLSFHIDKFRYEQSNQHIDRCQYDPLHLWLKGRYLCMLKLFIGNKPSEGGG